MLKQTVGHIWLFALLIFVGFTYNLAAPKIEDAVIARDVKPDNKEPVSITSSFEPDVPIVHCVIKVSNAKSDTKIKVRWIAASVPGVDANYLIAETEAPVKNGFSDFILTKPDNGFPPGDYRVDIFLDPEKIKDNKPTRAVTFAVKGAAAPAASSTEPGVVTVQEVYFAFDKEGKNVSKEFKPETRIIYLTAILSRVKVGTKITARWIAAKVDGVDPNYEIVKADATFDKESTVFLSNIELPEGKLFPPGEYRVDLYINDGKTPVGSGSFKVVE